MYYVSTGKRPINGHTSIKSSVSESDLLSQISRSLAEADDVIEAGMEFRGSKVFLKMQFSRRPQRMVGEPVADRQAHRLTPKLFYQIENIK